MRYRDTCGFDVGQFGVFAAQPVALMRALASGIMPFMYALRPTRHLARMVLAWFVFAMGVAVASPLVKPQSWQMVCSASGVVKLLSIDDNGVATAAGHPIECPLCWLPGAPPPPAQSLPLAAQAVSHVGMPPLGVSHVGSLTAPPLPARGPPSLS